MYIIGINHKTAPIDIREQLFLNEIQQKLFLSELKSDPSVLEVFILSTCNRTEIYVRLLDEERLTTLIDLIFKIKNLEPNPLLKDYFYIYSKKEAVEHFLSVVTGLDSLVLGEKQILGQVKKAIDLARDQGLLGKYMNVLTNLALRAGKKAQAETGISSGGSSVSWAAIAMAERIMGALESKSLLIIGAGKMGELALNQITRKGLKKLYILNRTEANAKELAIKYQAEPVAFCDIKDVLSEVDFCICSSGAPHYILEPTTIQKVMKERQNKPLFFIDISMPRNIDPKVGELPNVTLKTIDDLDKVVGENMLKREAAIQEVRQIIHEKIQDFYIKIEKIETLDQYKEPVLMES